MLTQSFMTIAERRHKVPKLPKRVLKVFVKYFCYFCHFSCPKGIGHKKLRIEN